MAAPRKARSSRLSTPSTRSSRSRTPLRATESSPLPIRASAEKVTKSTGKATTRNLGRRSSRLSAIKNSSQGSEAESDPITVGDVYMSRDNKNKVSGSANFKEVRVPALAEKTTSVSRSSKHARSPSTASSASMIQLEQQSPYETPSTSAAATPGDVGAKRTSQRNRQSGLLSSAVFKDGDQDDGIVVVSGTGKGKGKMTEREWMELDDAKLAEELQTREYQKRPTKKPSNKRKRAIPASDGEFTESTASFSSASDESSEEDLPLILPAPKRRAGNASGQNVVDAIPVDSESEFCLPDSGLSSAGGLDKRTTYTSVRKAMRARVKASREAAQQAIIDLFSDGDEEEDAVLHRYWGMTRMERGQYTLNKHHPELRTLWQDLEKVPVIQGQPRPQPPGLSRQLKPFQLEGVDWMIKQERSQWKGGLLGDEMGMGKTIQAVSLIMSDHEQTKDKGKPSLVVVPPVALMQWQSEISMYTDGKLKVLVHHNTDSKVKKLKVADLKKYDVILISYSGLESMYRKESKGWVRGDDLVKENSKIHALHFHRLILDEAHSIKSRTTGVARACFALKSDFKWCLSGTPVQNRIGEFFSLLRFLEVRPFACYFCKLCDCKQLHWSQDEKKQCTSCHHTGFTHVSIFNQELLNPITQAKDTLVRKEALAKLRLITDRIMLRRVKRNYTASMELPPKEVIIDNEFFGDVERDFSSSIMTNTNRQFDTYVSRGVVLNNYANIFGLIMQMRQVANHPDLILKKKGQSGLNVLVCCICDEPAEEAIRSRCRHEFCRKCAKDYIRSFETGLSAHGDVLTPDCPTCHIPLSIDFEQPDIEQEEDVVAKNSIINRITMDNWTSSSKIETLVNDLYNLRSPKQTAKSIVFSQFTSMLQLVEWRLRRAGFNTVMLDGTMNPQQRKRSIDYFMTKPDVEVFLVSLKAGGVALNLTEASRVFIVDPWWNPAAEHQSADRCHRIGQGRPCKVSRLVIEDSVESRMVLLQEKKANMIAGTVDNDDVALEKLTPEDMGFLFRGS